MMCLGTAWETSAATSPPTAIWIYSWQRDYSSVWTHFMISSAQKAFQSATSYKTLKCVFLKLLIDIQNSNCGGLDSLPKGLLHDSLGKISDVITPFLANRQIDAAECSTF